MPSVNDEDYHKERDAGIELVESVHPMRVRGFVVIGVSIAADQSVIHTEVNAASSSYQYRAP